MKKQDELVIITKTYDLILWSCNHTGRFPRQHRFVLGERLERSLYDLLETLIQAKYSRERTSLLNDANLKLEILRFQMRLAKDLECLQVKSYAFAAKQIDEIGKLVGGTGQAIRLHLVSGDPPDPKKPHIRLGGRIRCQAPC